MSCESIEALTRVPRSLNTPVPRSHVLCLLGSTGSIGVQTLHVAEEERLVVFALVCGRHVRLLSEQIKAWRPRYVSVQDENARQSLLLLLDAESKYRAMPEDKVALIAETSDILYNQKADQSPLLLVPSNAETR